ncbi:alpha-mannosidase [Brachybacterium sp. AOP43-C2-M15]|uniref:alpha-mannosidase n=1 Tax=Brachybacterium sp. AOP43-C2-M15 TaxID=3457661 RepID=UPI0040345341
MIGNSHIDPVWLWPWQEGYAEARATFRSAIDRMEEYPDFVFTCDQVVLLDWVREQDPELFARIRERAAEGRWVNTGGWWVEPDCNLPLGESFVRQGLYGQRFLLEHFGEAATVGMNVDPFGHHAMIPAILRGQGMDSYTFLRPGPHEAGDLPDAPFRWVAPDGSWVLACRIPFEYCSTEGDLAYQIDKSLAQLDRTVDPLMIFYGVGNHGGGPTRANLDSIARYQHRGTYGELMLSSPVAFFEAVRAGAHEEELELPRWEGDLQHHAAGCYSAHSGIKAWQVRAQHAVLTAERWAVIADVLGRRSNPSLADPRVDLTRAWQQVLFNQFHDVLPGSAIEAAYADARDQLGEAISIAHRITARAHGAIARNIEVPFQEGTQPVLVLNPHPWAVRTTVDMNYGMDAAFRGGVLDADGHEVPSQTTRSAASMEHPGRGAVAFTAEVPAAGYALFRLVPERTVPSTSLTSSGTSLENDHLRAEVDPETGWLGSLLDKGRGIDLLSGSSGGHLQVCADDSDTWGHHVVTYALPGEELGVERVELGESGPVRASIRVLRRWRSSTVVEEFVLHADGTALEARVEIDWREPMTVLKLRLPVALTGPAATYEIPFATMARPVDGAEEPAQSWVDLSGTTAAGRAAGLTVITTAKHGFDTSPADSPSPGFSPSIGITALRSPAYAWNDPRPLDAESDVGVHDQGRQAFRYLLVPHDGDWRHASATRRAAELRQPVRAMTESAHDGILPPRASFASDGGGAAMITALKGSEGPVGGSGDGSSADGEGGDVIVRAVETQGVRTSAVLDLDLVGRRLRVDLEPYQIRTFRVPRSPRRRVREVDLVERDLDGAPAVRSRRIASAPTW